MRRNTAIILGTAATAALVATEVAHARRGRQRIHLERHTRRSASTIIGTAAAVEAEPDLIPYVQAVKVLERCGDCVRYRVVGRTFGITWWMQYRKAWDYERGVVKWCSENGSYGIRNSGRLAVVPSENGNIITLDTGYTIHIPIIGLMLEQAVRPVLEDAFGKWLDNLAGIAEVPKGMLDTAERMA